MTSRKAPSVEKAGDVVLENDSTPTPDDSLVAQAQEVKQNSELHHENITARRWLIKILAWTSVGWLVFTAVVVFLHGFQCIDFSLSDPVMIALLTNSLVTVLGLWTIGLRYFFAIKK
ncbi:MAG: hypothetical protein FWC50_01210 [Planctomycetaceae bacterium]|nr:hypothetical protein [Planctomycetaceae bacterium]